jgi:hypothetical protein
MGNAQLEFACTKLCLRIALPGGKMAAFKGRFTVFLSKLRFLAKRGHRTRDREGFHPREAFGYESPMCLTGISHL